MCSGRGMRDLERGTVLLGMSLHLQVRRVSQRYQYGERDVIAFTGQMSLLFICIVEGEWETWRGEWCYLGCQCIYRSNEFHKAINMGKGMSLLSQIK